MKGVSYFLALPVLLATQLAYANPQPHPAQVDSPALTTIKEDAKEIEVTAPFLPPMERVQPPIEPMQMRSNLIRGL